MVTRPAYPYYGGKWLLADWIIGFFPKHEHYIELCGGSASVLLQKPPSKVETLNDVDDEVVNFYNVIRTQKQQFINAIHFTPWSRVEYEKAKVVDVSLPAVERALRFVVRQWQSIGNNGVGGWRHQTSTIPYSTNVSQFRKVEWEQIAERLLNVQIESKDAITVIAEYDSEKALFYFDPPYVESTRTASNVYTHEVDEAFHVAAAESLNRIKGAAIVSGYESELYDELYRGWHKERIEAQINGGGKRNEVLWINKKGMQNIPRQQSLF